MLSYIIDSHAENETLEHSYEENVKNREFQFQLKPLLRLFSVKRFLWPDKTRPDTYAVFLGRKRFVIKGTGGSGGEGYGGYPS